MSLAVFFAVYCLEAGLFFLIVPWTRLWTLNPLLHSTYTITMLAGDPFVRGFISGVGVMHLIIGVKEIVRLARQQREAAE
jgi:hypothetical protein